MQLAEKNALKFAAFFHFPPFNWYKKSQKYIYFLVHFFVYFWNVFLEVYLANACV